MNAGNTKTGAPLPEHCYLIGCEADSSSVATLDVSAQLMGFKAYNLSKMSALGLPVPPAFVLGTPWCSSDTMRARH